MESAFEDTKGYELTELGQQFVYYAMTDLPLRIGFGPSAGPSEEVPDYVGFRSSSPSVPLAVCGSVGARRRPIERGLIS